MSALEVINGERRWWVGQGNCLELLGALPAGSVAHAITDPPYSEHVHSKQRRMLRGVGGPHVGAAPLGFAAITYDERVIVAKHLGRLVRRWALVFSDAESVGEWRRALGKQRLRHVRTGAWVKVNGQPQLSGDRPAVGFEAIEIAHGPAKCAWHNGGHAAVWHFAVANDRNRRGERVHTTQKPLELMLALVEQFTNPDDLVLDPFAGSGTTGVACLRLGRRFIGFEVDEKYAAVARERCAAESRGLSLPDARAGQISIFDLAEARVVTVEQKARAALAQPIPDVKTKRILQLRLEGLPLATIAERLGLHINTVWKHLQRRGLVERRRCSCGRKLRGHEATRCYVCRGYRVSKTRDAGAGP